MLLRVFFEPYPDSWASRGNERCLNKAIIMPFGSPQDRLEKWKQMVEFLQVLMGKMIQVMKTMALLTVFPTVRAGMMQMSGLTSMLIQASSHAKNLSEVTKPSKPQVSEARQARCDHTHPDGKTAWKSYGGNWGRAKRCQLCRLRYRWNAFNQEWDLWPEEQSQASSSHSQPPSTAPKAAPKSRTQRPTWSLGYMTSQAYQDSIGSMSSQDWQDLAAAQ